MRKTAAATDPKLAVALVRVSTDEQKNGPEVQRAEIEAWATRENVRIAAWFTEHESGKKELDNRTGLLDALDALAVHAAGVLVVHKRDRLARRVEIAAAVERLVKDRGAVVQTASGEGNGHDAESALMRQILDAFAEYEGARISLRTRAGMAAKVRRGEFTGVAPMGSMLAPDDRTLVPDPAEQAILAKARELHAAGLSYCRVGRELAALGMFSRTGNPYVAQQVKRMCAQERAN